MVPVVGHCMATLLIVLVFGVWVERIVWRPRRPYRTWQLRGLRVAWIAAIFGALGVAAYGFDLTEMLVGATLGALLGMVEVVSWTCLPLWRRARTPLR
jgi:hypothetical protein